MALDDTGASITPQSLGVTDQADTASAPLSFSTIYAFGDSLSDAGNIYDATLHLVPASPPYSDGRFTNGAVWVQDLAGQLGLVLPKPSLEGGTDFAYGDAETGTTPSHSATPIDLPSQLRQFDAAIPSPRPDALYTLSIGSNDVLDAISAAATDPAKANATIVAAVANEDSFIQSLAARGAHTLDILTVPDLGKTPSESSGGPFASFVASYLSAVFDIDLMRSLQTLTNTGALKIDLVDGYALLDRAVANPAAYGITNTTTPVWTGNYYNPLSGKLNATTPAAQNQYLFWDGLHPTAQGHSVVAATALQSLSSGYAA